MSQTVLESVPVGRSAAGEYRATFADVLRSEWTKLRSLRSTAYTLAAFVVLGVGLAAVVGAGTGSSYGDLPAHDKADFDPLGPIFVATVLVQLAIAVLGVLMMTSEYATGMIRPSVAAVPRRSWLLAAKAVVFTAVSLVVGMANAFGMLFMSQSMLKIQDAPTVALGDAGVLRTVVGTGLFLTILGLLAVAVGTLVRWTAGAVTVLTAGLLIVPNVATTLPDAWSDAIQKFYPTSAGLQIVSENSDGLSPWAGLGWMTLFVAIMLAVAFYVFKRRDV